MSRRRPLVRLVRQPAALVGGLLVLAGLLLALVAVSLASVEEHALEPPQGARARVAASTLPAATQQPPRRRVHLAQVALRSVEQACNQPSRWRKRGSVRKPLDVIEAFAAHFPDGGFVIGGEQGSTLALLVVVWKTLDGCDLGSASRVERLIPLEYRGD